MRILIINGVNLNLTGEREKEIYGTKTLDEINEEIATRLRAQGDEVEFYQSNVEGEICNRLHLAFHERNFDGIILNAGAYTHYSIAIRDAIKGIDLPVVEVHMSNVYAREEFRQTSVIAPVCVGSISGFGAGSYLAGVYALKLKKEGVV